MSTIILEQIEPEILTTGEDLQPPEITPEPHEAEIVEQEFVPVTNEIIPTPPTLPAPKKRARPPTSSQSKGRSKA